MPIVSRVDRVLDIVELLADYPEGLSISDIARRLSLPKSETFRLLALLTRRDFTVQEQANQRYRLSVRAAAIGCRFFGRLGLDELCQPILERLAARLGELVRLTMVDAENLIWVSKAQGASGGLRCDPHAPHMGMSPTLHATANGRAWLATLPDEEAMTLVNRHGFILPPGYFRSHINDEPSLRDELARTRARGYGVAIDEAVQGVSAVAVAVPGRADGKAFGTISVEGPTIRMTEARIQAIAPDVLAAARELAAIWPLRGAGHEAVPERRRA